MDPLNILNMYCGSLPAACHPSYIPLKVYVLVVQIRPWHVLWLSPLLQLVSWGAGLGVLPPSGLLSLNWTRWQLRQCCVGELYDTSLISFFDPLIDWLQEQRINRAHKSRFHSPLWSGSDKVERPELSIPPLPPLCGRTAIEGGSVPW